MTQIYQVIILDFSVLQITKELCVIAFTFSLVVVVVVVVVAEGNGR
jgi:hypothetical protein